MEDITEIKHLGEHHDFFVQSDTLLLADVFENFTNECLEIYEFWSCKIFFSSWISWMALKDTKVKLDLLTDIDMLTMVEVIRGGICHCIY